MSNTRIDVKFNDFPKIAKKLPKAVGTIMTKGTHDIEAHADSQTPVDTGNLKSSKSTSITDGGLDNTISWSADYAGHVNYGTRNQAAQPFATDAAEKVFPSIINALRQLEGKL